MNARQLASRLTRSTAKTVALTALALGLATTVFVPGSAYAQASTTDTPVRAFFNSDLVPTFSTAGNAHAGGPVGFYAGVRNIGPFVATPVRMAIGIPSGLEDVSIEPGEYSCSRSADIITCTLPVLGSGDARAVIVRGTAPRQSGTYGVVINVDPNNQVGESNERNNAAAYRLASY